MKRVTSAALAVSMSTVLGLGALAAGAMPAIAARAAEPAAQPSPNPSRVPAAKPSARPSAKPGPASSAPLLEGDGIRPQPIGPGVTSRVCDDLASQPPSPARSTPPTSTPWAEKVMNFTNVWPITQGTGVTVAVVDSGVDYTAQLKGRLTGIDLTGTGLEDCAGHGTLVAGLIGAADEQNGGNPFYGVAPAANILSVKVQLGSSTDSNGIKSLAQGIYDAAFLGARVISVSIQSPPSPLLAYAVQYAISRKAVIVAAAGNDHQPGQPAHGPFYPADYPGVLAVGALNTDGTLNAASDQYSNVQVTAPGVGIWSTAPYGYTTDQGTSFATPFVSGVAALIIASHPGITGQEVINRIVDTAGGNVGPGTGAGMVNPVAAVTALTLPAAPPTAGSGGHPVPVGRALPPDLAARNTAMVVTVGSLGGASLLVIAVVVIGQGRRRRWRPR